jgi:hypothetical protein
VREITPQAQKARAPDNVLLPMASSQAGLGRRAGLRLSGERQHRRHDSMPARTADGKPYIETVSKSGYRIAVPVRPRPDREPRHGFANPASAVAGCAPGGVRAVDVALLAGGTEIRFPWLTLAPPRC